MNQSVVIPWSERIRQARERGSFSKDDKYLAGNWPSCACGEQDAEIPREDHPEHGRAVPIDVPLRNLGYEFFRHVELHRFDEAETVLAKIQRRAKRVLAKQGPK